MQAAMYFKRGRDSNYMMRSEKRPGYPNTPPQKPKKSIWYQVLTVILLILVCPVGLILLWRKRMGWPNPAKLLATLLSLVMLFLELGAALVYPFEDARLRSAQHAASTAISGFVSDMADNWSAVVDNGQEIGAAAGNHMLGMLLDAIASPTPAPTQVPPLTLNQGEGSGDDIASLMNKPTATPTPTPTPEPTATPEPTPTATPEATPEASANTLERPTPSGSLTPSLDPNASATPVPPVTPTPSPTATPLVTPTPTPTVEPTIDPASIPKIQNVGETMVWHTSNGKWYHKASECGTMSNASQYTLASAVSKGKTACPYCYPIDEQWAREDEPVVYVSADNYWHIRWGCESNTDEWTPMLLDEARGDRSLAPCDACGSRYYVDGVPSALTGRDGENAGQTDVQSEATREPAQLKKAGEVTVWHTSNGKWYHKASKCGTMSNAGEYTLASAVANGKTACPYCHPIGEEWANVNEEVVFVSTKSVWHAESDCRANTDEWTVMTLSDARNDGALSACAECGAKQYSGGAATSKTAAAQVTATPAPGTTPAPTPIEDGLNLNNVTNGDTLVYYSGNTSHYHRRDRCASSTTTVFQPHSLMEALIAGKIACPVCNPPEPET